MSSMRFEVSGDALNNIAEIARHALAFRSREKVVAMIDALEATFHELCENPLAHAVYQFEPPISLVYEYRRASVDMCKVFYWIEGGTVRTARTLHVRSDFTTRGM